MLTDGLHVRHSAHRIGVGTQSRYHRPGTGACSSCRGKFRRYRHNANGEVINDLKTVDYSAMSALYVEAMKELAKRVKSIESELAELKARSAI